MLWVFSRNAKHLEDVVNNKAENDQLLNILDRTAIYASLLGVLFSSIVGISTAVNSYMKKEHEMTDKKTVSHTAIAYNSVGGISNMKPSSTEELSVEGISNMRPSNATQNLERLHTANCDVSPVEYENCKHKVSTFG